MFEPRQEDAEKKFWRTPDLIETLLPFLDANSTLALVKVLPLALDIVQMKTMWIKLVERTCPYDSLDVSVSGLCFCLPRGCCDCGAKVLEKLNNDKRELMLLVEILKLMSEATKPRLSELLHLICRRFPPGEDSDDETEGPDNWTEGPHHWTEESGDEAEESDDETGESDDETEEPNDETEESNDETEEYDDETEESDDETEESNDETEESDDETEDEDEPDDWREESDDETAVMNEFIQVICTQRNHTSHEVSPHGFLLLEAVEGAMGTTVQMVERVVRHFPKEIELIALEARLLHQRDLGVETRVDSHQLTVDSMEGARAIKALMQYCHTVNIRFLKITADIGMEGWRDVSEAISFKEVELSLRTKSKNCLASARTEDLTSMWKNPNFHNLVFEEDGGSRVFVTEGFFGKLLDTQANVFPELNLYDNYRRLL